MHVRAVIGLSLLAALMARGAVAQVGWFQQNPPSASYSLLGVSFTDEKTGTAVGSYGTIIHTTDGGSTWVAQSSGTANTLMAVSFTNANTGTAVGLNGTIVHTTNGGATWVTQTCLPAMDLQSVSFTDANTGTAVGQLGLIIRTTDGGSHWIRQFSEAGDWLRGVSFVDDSTGTAVGYNDMIIRTTNGGATWYRLHSGTTSVALATFEGVCFTDAVTGTVVGPGVILRTTDGGAHWSEHLTETGALRSVSFVDANTGTAVGGGGTILRTTNGGSTWVVQTSGTTEFLNAVSLANATTGTIVGRNGTILRTTTGGDSITGGGIDPIIPTEPLLMQNFPNPFNPSTTIRYVLPQPTHVTIEIFNVLGSRIVVLQNGDVGAGQHDVRFDGDELPGGMYVCRMRAGGVLQCRKLLLLK